LSSLPRAKVLVLTVSLLFVPLGFLHAAHAQPCQVCILKKPGTNRCLKWAHSCVSRKVPYHFHRPSPVQSKAPHIYRHYPSHH